MSGYYDLLPPSVRHRDREEHDDTDERLRVLDVDRMLSEPPPPIDWCAEPLLVRGRLTMLAGHEGQGKSMLALALAAAIGDGATVAGIACDPGRTLIVDAENGEDEAWRRVHGLGIRPGTLTYVEADGFDLRRDFALLEALVDERDPMLVVLDSLRSLAPGLEENDSGQAEAAIRPISRMAQERGAAVLLLHHAGKAGHQYRGSSAIGAAVELGFTMSRRDDDPEKRTRRKIECWKCRPAPEPGERWIALGLNAMGKILLDETEPFVPERESPVTDAIEEALAVFIAGEVSRCHHPYTDDTVTPSWTIADLARAIGREPKDQSVRRAIDRLQSERDAIFRSDRDRRWHPIIDYFEAYYPNGNGNGHHVEGDGD